MKLDLKAALNLIKEYWLLVVIVVAASWLRTWQLETQGILFGDAGKDLLTAYQAVTDGKWPLLGIESSVPRFHQGPLTLWLEMLLIKIGGVQTLPIALVFAGLGIAAVIMLYEWAALYLTPKVGVIATALLAFSPLAVAHSRVPYHTTPIPLVMIGFLFGLIHLWQGKRWGLLAAVLSWTLILQFELSLFALGLMIPYILWRQRVKLRVYHLSQAGAALLIGLSPQLIHDLSNPLAQNQVGGFLAWVGYRLISVLGVTGEHSFSLNRLGETLGHFGQYLHRLYGVESVLFSGVFVFAAAWTGARIFQRLQLKKAPTKSARKRPHLLPAIEILAVSTFLLTTSYFVHGQPSEAYFPPYFVLLSLLLGWGLGELADLIKSRFKFNGWALMGVAIAIWASLNMRAIWQQRFFVSNNSSFSYGASTGEQRAILSYLDRLTDWRFYLASSDRDVPESQYANFAWLALEQGLQDQYSNPVLAELVFYVEAKDSSLSTYPNITKVEFPTYDIYYH